MRWCLSASGTPQQHCMPKATLSQYPLGSDLASTKRILPLQRQTKTNFTSLRSSIELSWTTLNQTDQDAPNVESCLSTYDLPALTRMLLFDVTLLKNPVAHDSHLGWAVTEPDATVYLPGEHLVWAIQESVSTLFTDSKALKNPGVQASHSGWLVAFPTVFV